MDLNLLVIVVVVLVEPSPIAILSLPINLVERAQSLSFRVHNYPVRYEFGGIRPDTISSWVENYRREILREFSAERDL